jgi:hypothetical protein
MKQLLALLMIALLSIHSLPAVMTMIIIMLLSPVR